MHAECMRGTSWCFALRGQVIALQRERRAYDAMVRQLLAILGTSACAGDLAIVIVIVRCR